MLKLGKAVHYIHVGCRIYFKVPEQAHTPEVRVRVAWQERQTSKNVGFEQEPHE